MIIDAVRRALAALRITRSPSRDYLRSAAGAPEAFARGLAATSSGTFVPRHTYLVDDGPGFPVEEPPAP